MKRQISRITGFSFKPKTSSHDNANRITAEKSANGVNTFSNFDNIKKMQHNKDIKQDTIYSKLTRVPDKNQIIEKPAKDIVKSKFNELRLQSRIQDNDIIQTIPTEHVMKQVAVALTLDTPKTLLPEIILHPTIFNFNRITGVFEILNFTHQDLFAHLIFSAFLRDRDGNLISRTAGAGFSSDMNALRYGVLGYAEPKKLGNAIDILTRDKDAVAAAEAVSKNHDLSPFLDNPFKQGHLLNLRKDNILFPGHNALPNIAEDLGFKLKLFPKTCAFLQETATAYASQGREYTLENRHNDLIKCNKILKEEIIEYEPLSDVPPIAIALKHSRALYNSNHAANLYIQNIVKVRNVGL